MTKCDSNCGDGHHGISDLQTCVNGHSLIPQRHLKFHITLHSTLYLLVSPPICQVKLPLFLFPLSVADQDVKEETQSVMIKCPRPLEGVIQNEQPFPDSFMSVTLPTLDTMLEVGTDDLLPNEVD